MKTLPMLYVAILIPALCGAADIYRWVDENGRTQVSDIVPQKYLQTATKIGSRTHEPSAAQRNEAESRAAKDKARADALAKQNTAAEAEGANPATVKSDQTQLKAGKSGCAALQATYRSSQDCFAPYRLANGAVKSEAFEKCGGGVPDPSSQCGPVEPDPSAR